MCSRTALSCEFFSVITELLGPRAGKNAQEFAANLLFDFARSLGAFDQRDFAQTMASDNDGEENVVAFRLHLTYTGWGKVCFTPLTLESSIPDDYWPNVFTHYKRWQSMRCLISMQKRLASSI